jgi:3-isopropylmalate/(R)-2-methylmalate dehydratase large subunit
MTIAEKILARKSGQAKVGPGDLVTAEVDTVVMIDNSFTAGRWRDIQKVRDPDRIVVVFDHRVPASTEDSAAAHRTGRGFVAKFGIKRFHDVGYDQGISHQLVADHGYALPGTLLVCSDSHTCSAGVFNCLARGVGEPDVLYSAIKGETWFRVGETIRYELEGKLSPAVTTKDAFLQIAGKHGDHATQNIEWGGSGVGSLSIAARKTLPTLSAERSAEFTTCEADDVMKEWLRARNPQPFEGIEADKDAQYAAVRMVNLSGLEPLVACCYFPLRPLRSLR